MMGAIDAAMADPDDAATAATCRHDAVADRQILDRDLAARGENAGSRQ